MTRETYVRRGGKIVLKLNGDGVVRESGPFVISDDLGSDLLHHGYDDSRTTSSKSEFRRWTKDAGLVEKGNDRQKSERRLGSPTQDVVRDVAIATQMVKGGYKPKPLRYFEE